MVSKTPLPCLGLCSHEKESQKHPGKPDVPRARQTTEEVQAEKVEKVYVQAEREEMRAQNIQRAAEIETRIEVQMKDKLETAHHPPLSMQIKVLHPRNKALMAPEAAKDNVTEDSEEATEVRDPVSSGSDNVYVPDKDTELVESEDDEEVLDESSEDNAGGKKVRKRKKPGQGSLRTAVKSAQGKSVPEDGLVKQKATPSQKTIPHGHPPKKPRKTNIGLYDDWNEQSQWERGDDNAGDVEMEDIRIVSTHGHSHSASSGMSFSSSSQPPTSPPDSDHDHKGGIADDTGKRSERKNLSGKAVKSMLQRHYYYGGGSNAGETGIHSLAHIVPTISVPKFITPSTSSQADFTDKFTPCLYELFGTLNAWEQPKEADLQKLWKSVFPDEQSLYLRTSEGTVILKLIEDRLSQWRKKFGERALEALEEITFNDLPKNNSAHREWWCTWALSGSDDICQPFYYATYEEPDPEIEGSQLKIKGVFQSPLIATILGSHMAWLSLIEEKICSERKPISALVHSIQAVKHAISWWQTGDMVKPKKPLNEYSKVNWGDHIETRDGHTIHINSTSIAIVSKVKDKQWEKILTVARASGKRKKKVVVVVSDTPEPSQVALAELRDDDSDLTDEN